MLHYLLLAALLAGRGFMAVVPATAFAGLSAVLAASVRLPLPGRDGSRFGAFGTALARLPFRAAGASLVALWAPVAHCFGAVPRFSAFVNVNLFLGAGCA